jgi:hypothetical protein
MNTRVDGTAEFTLAPSPTNDPTYRADHHAGRPAPAFANERTRSGDLTTRPGDTLRRHRCRPLGRNQVTTDSDLRLRHLDTVQATITRLAQNSFTIRGWSVTLVSAVLAIMATQSKTPPSLILFALAPAWIFWALDTYYLHQERLLRRHHAAIARRLHDEHAPDITPFDMDLTPYRTATTWWAAARSPHTTAIPVTLTLLILAFWLIRR